MTEETVVTEETTQELVPVMASECCSRTYTTNSYRNGTCPMCGTKGSGTVNKCSKCGVGWIKMTVCGHSIPLKDE